MQTLVSYHPDFPHEGYTLTRKRLEPTFQYLKNYISDLKDEAANTVKFEVPSTIDQNLIKQVHSQQLIKHVTKIRYYKVALLSAGSTVLCADKVWNGRVKNTFAFTGTAGHHASVNSCWGFSYLNHIALAIAHLRQNYEISRILIVDTDPHLGDGTKKIFKMDPNVLHLDFYVSKHVKELNYSHKIDIPLPPEISDNSHNWAVKRVLDHIKLPFDLMFWYFGHDGHYQDYGGWQLTLYCYPALADVIIKASERLCNGRLVTVLGGGENIEIAQSSITSVITRMANVPSPVIEDEEPVELPETFETVKDTVNKILNSYNDP
ncbi:MAG: hypothetical protein ACFFCQ_12345 [Promethearchaeota archaeon]